MVEREHVDEELVESWAIAGRLLPGELPAWSIRLVSDLGVQGRCLPATREIVVSDTRGGLDRVVTVVHERAHALAGGGHGPAWQALMQRAIVECEDDALRDALEFEVGSYRFDRSSAVPTASDVLWSAARRAGKDLDADLGGVFAVVPRLRDLCLSLQEEALEAEREAEISSLPANEAPEPECPLPERVVTQAAARRWVRCAVDELSRQYAARREEVLAVFPEFADLLDSLDVGLDPELWPELDASHFV